VCALSTHGSCMRSAQTKMMLLRKCTKDLIVQALHMRKKDAKVQRLCKHTNDANVHVLRKHQKYENVHALCSRKIRRACVLKAHVCSRRTRNCGSKWCKMHQLGAFEI
jgi:hypothetical protein